MLSEKIDTLSSLTEMYDRAKNDLARIRTEYADNEILLSIYENSALRLIKGIQRDILLTLELDSPEAQNADVWITLDGPELVAQHIPIGVIGKFLQGLSIANKHAVSIIEGLKHEQGRFNQHVHDLAEFTLASVLPGSIQIGVRKPNPERFMPEEHNVNQEKLFGSSLHASFEALEQSDRAIEGLSLLLRTIESATDESKIAALRDEVGQRNVLRLLYHAQELTPSRRGLFVTVSVSGEGIPSVRCDLQTREKLRSASKNLLENQRYIEAFGKIRMVDMDKRLIKARPFYGEDFHVDEIEGKLSDQMTDDDFEAIINKPVHLCGVVVLSETGDIKYLEVDDIELLEMDS